MSSKDIEDCKAELERLKLEVKAKEVELSILRQNRELDLDEIARYSRQLILPEIGVSGQKKLRNGRVLIVGAGGLGCPAAQYLVAAGVGVIGIVDYDVVEVSNLHRQILHSEARIGRRKVDSVAEALLSLNSRVSVIPFHVALNSTNASQIVSDFDVVLDATDNVATRYLLNDACVILGKPLVSGSALRFEGQMTVYNYPPEVGPTYRCLFPTPPPPETVTNCSDGGVLGVVPGIIGSLQALEAIKILIGSKMKEFITSGRLLIFDAFSGGFRSVKLRSRRVPQSNVTELIDYEQFCGSKAGDKDDELSILDPQTDRIDSITLSRMLKERNSCVLLDVRSETEMEIGRIEGSVNIPFSHLAMKKDETFTNLKSKIQEVGSRDLFVICRKGNDSQKAVKILRDVMDNEIRIRDVIGGLYSWARNIDSSFPIY